MAGRSIKTKQKSSCGRDGFRAISATARAAWHEKKGERNAHTNRCPLALSSGSDRTLAKLCHRATSHPFRATGSLSLQQQSSRGTGARPASFFFIASFWISA